MEIVEIEWNPLKSIENRVKSIENHMKSIEIVWNVWIFVEIHEKSSKINENHEKSSKSWETSPTKLTVNSGSRGVGRNIGRYSEVQRRPESKP